MERALPQGTETLKYLMHSVTLYEPQEYSHGSWNFSKYIKYYKIKREVDLRDIRALLNITWNESWIFLILSTQIYVV